jgi:hypothetical protein
MAGSRIACLVLVAAALAAPATAGWWELQRADADFDLPTARAEALRIVADDPGSAEAVAAANWWLENLYNLPEPAEILDAVEGRRDPELGFVLARIEGQLSGRPPSGSLSVAELAGPFGVFDTLDLERDAEPADDDLPPLGTGWRGPAEVYRVRLRTADGTVSVPEAMDAGGVSLAAWTFALDRQLDGWLVLEAAGGVNPSLDGRELGRLRHCGIVDPEVSWFRLHLDPGRHRLRVAMASPRGARVRLSLFDDQGAPVSPRLLDDAAGPWAPSDAVRELPPASAGLAGRLARPGAVPELLLAASLAGGRGDPIAERRWLELARDSAPEDPWPRLALTWFYLMRPTGLDADENTSAARRELRGSRSIPIAALAERALAVREQRPEEVERVLTELVDRYGDDNRVQQLWLGEATRRGWAREVEDGIADLVAELPESLTVIELRLAALEALERWRDRRVLLLELVAQEPIRLRWVEQIASGCLADEAVAALRRMRERVDDPNLDVALLRLQLGRGDGEGLRSELEEARRRWGDLEVLDQAELMLDAEDAVALEGSLAAALEGDPSNLQLRTLAWRLGAEPFFEPFRVAVEDITAAEKPVASGTDVVLMLDQAVERIYPDGSAIYYYHGLSRAITPIGAQRSSTLQQLPEAFLLKVRIIKPDGSVVIPAMLESRNGTVTISDVKVGDLVEEEYVARVAATGASRRGHLSPYVYRFADPERAFGLSEYVLLVPPEVELKVDGNFTGLDRQEYESDGLRVVRWRAESVPAAYREPFAPPPQELLPWVSYGFGVSWQDVGDIFRDRVLGVLRSSPDLERWSGELLADEDPARAARRLVEAVCEEVEPGRSVLSLGSTAGESFSRRRGNRLGIVAAALADAGWQVDLVMARPRPFAGTHLAVPTLETFSEPLLRARTQDRELWFDLEEQRRGVDHIRPILQGGDALVLPLTRPREPVSMLDSLPAFANPELEQRVTVAATIDARGDARISFEMDLDGPDAEQMLERAADDRPEMMYQQIAGNLFPGANEVEGSVARTPDGATVRLGMVLPHACDPVGDRLSCRSLVLARPLVPALASLPERRYPLVLQLPILQRLELVIVLPEGWSMERSPRRLVTDWGSLEEELVHEPGRVRSVVTLEVLAQTVSPEDYEHFARFCHALDELASRPPLLRKNAE